MRIGPGFAVVLALASGSCKCNDPARRAAPVLDAAADQPHIQVVGGDIPQPPPADPALPLERRLRVLDAGAAPRKLLRYGLAPTAERTIVETLQITTRTLDDSAWTTPVKLPPIRQGLAVEVTADQVLRLRPLPLEIASGGDGNAQDLAARLSMGWSRLERRRATVTADPVGRLSTLVFADAPPGGARDPSLDELWQLLLGLVVRLPDDAVGPGARWQVSSVLRMGAATVEQIEDFKLIAVDGDRWTVDIDLRRIGEPQDTGHSVELVGLFREVTGTITMTSTDPMPVAGELTTETRVHARAPGPDGHAVDHASEDVGTITVGAQ